MKPPSVSYKVSGNEEWLRLRHQYMGGSESAILLGIEKYQSYYELWHRKKGTLEEPELDSVRVVLGRHLEEGVIAAARELHGSNIRIVRRYVARTDIRMGASMDAEEAIEGMGWVPAEVKVVSWGVWREDWAEDGDGEVHVPLHIAIQCQHYMAVTGAPCAVLYVLVGGEKVERIVVERRDSLVALLEQRIAEFWADQERGDDPRPDYAMDFDAMRQVLTNVAPEPKKPIDWTGDEQLTVLVASYREHKARYDEADERMTELKARILEHLGEQQRVKATGATISAKLKPASEEYTRETVMKAQPARREFRITLTKESADE